MDATQEKSMQDFGSRNLKEGIFEDNINLDSDGGWIRIKDQWRVVAEKAYIHI
jgi:hypothetical protein